MEVQQRCCRRNSADRSGAKKQPILAQHDGELPATLQNAVMTKKRKSHHQGPGSVRDSEADIAQPCVCLLCCPLQTRLLLRAPPRAAFEHDLHAGSHMIAQS